MFHSKWLTLIKDSATVPNLAEEDAAFGMNRIHNGLPCFHLLSGPYSRYIRIASQIIEVKLLVDLDKV